MPFGRDKEARQAGKDERHALEQRAAEARRKRDSEPDERWEYQVKRIGMDKQKGLLGSGRMEQIFNREGAKGWELVAVEAERATFKRRVVSISSAELEELATVEDE